jgi:hypothetical protein
VTPPHPISLHFVGQTSITESHSLTRAAGNVDSVWAAYIQYLTPWIEEQEFSMDICWSSLL